MQSERHVGPTGQTATQASHASEGKPEFDLVNQAEFQLVNQKLMNQELMNHTGRPAKLQVQP